MITSKKRLKDSEKRLKELEIKLKDRLKATDKAMIEAKNLARDIDRLKKLK